LVFMLTCCSTEANSTKLLGELIGVERRQRILVLQLRGQELKKGVVVARHVCSALVVDDVELVPVVPVAPVDVVEMPDAGRRAGERRRGGRRDL